MYHRGNADNPTVEMRGGTTADECRWNTMTLMRGSLIVQMLSGWSRSICGGIKLVSCSADILGRHLL